MKKQRVMHNIPFQFVAFAGFHSFYSLLQYQQTQLILICEIQGTASKMTRHCIPLILPTAVAQSCKYQTALCIKLHSEHNVLCASYTSYGHTATTECRHDGKKKWREKKDFVVIMNMRKW